MDWQNISNQRLRHRCSFPLALALLCFRVTAVVAQPAILTKNVSFEVHSDFNPGGRQVYMAGTTVDAIPAANGQFQVVVSGGPKFLLPASSLRFESDASLVPKKALVPLVRPTRVNTTPQPPETADFKTVSGKVYRNARLARVEPDGITYLFAGGVVKIPLDELPQAIRSKYNLTPEKAALFQRSEEDAERREAEEKAANEEREAARRIVSNTFPILQIETDTADFVGQEFYVRGVVDISTSYLGKYSDERETQYAFVISDGRSSCYCYAPKDPYNNGVRLHELILANSKPAEGLFLLRIAPEKYRRGQSVITADFIRAIPSGE